MDQERQSMEVDIACVGFGPAMGGFLTTLSRQMADESGQPILSSKVMEGMPLQVVCYERSDDIGFGVSGVVTKGESIKGSFPDLNCAEIPMCCPVKKEKLVYLLDPVGASRRPGLLKMTDKILSLLKWLPFVKDEAFEMPYIPPFLHKKPGLVFSVGQFNQWVGSQLMGSGLVQIWPGMPVGEPLLEGQQVEGVRMVDQGVDKRGQPDTTYMPGMDIKAALTVVGDGPVGPIGQKLDDHFGLPDGNHQRDWAVGMKGVIELPKECKLEAGTVLHTFGFPEPEIFGFLYVYPDNIASLGIFVPSTMNTPVRTAYRYFQYWMQHPYLWKHLKGGSMRSWGAKTLQESAMHGEPFLAGDGYARIGEGSGSTNMLTGSGVDEAWETGVQLAEAVIALAKEGKSFSKENLESTYVKRRRESALNSQLEKAKKARDGFHHSFIGGMIGMGLTGLTGGLLNFPSKTTSPFGRVSSLEDYYKNVIPEDELKEIEKQCLAGGTALHGALMERVGWPEIPLDGLLLISHQDALLLGGKVQAADGYADHVIFLKPELCKQCNEKICIECCSGQAILPSEEGGVPDFDREKCIHCGACLWNCSKSHPDNPEKGNISFQAGSGGLHSAEN